MKKISVVTICYNSASCIERTIQSVIKQTYQDVEYIIIDGKSTDNTLAIVERYRMPNMVIISEHDQGPFDAMNKGLEIATGEWVIFMNSGDYFANEYVLSDVFAKRYDDYDVLHGYIYRNFISSETLWKDIPFYDLNKKYKGMNICHQSIFTRTSVAKKMKFDTSYRMSADYDMMMRIFTSSGKFKQLEIPIAVYDTTGMSNVNRLKTFEEECRICKLSKLSMIYWFYKLKITVGVFLNNLKYRK